MKAQKIIQVDAFTDRPFAGNPAAVCVMEGAAEAGWMQEVAKEMNLSETAFLHPAEPREGRGRGDAYDLRWFTPTAEVDLCGHATLASAHVLWEEGHLPPEQPARFFTKSGELVARRAGAWIEMDFPATPPTETAPPPGLVKALGVVPVYVGKGRFDYLLEVETETVVRKLDPDLSSLAKLDVRGVIVTARAETGELDFVSRCFYPAVGVPEDPVTGSAHCTLGPYWQPRLQKDSMTAYQASARGGLVRVKVDGDRVLLGGQAVTVLRGELLGLEPLSD